jgi:hypothetical protein
MFEDTHKDSLQVDEGVRRSLVVLDYLPCQLWDIVAWNQVQKQEQIAAVKLLDC